MMGIVKHRPDPELWERTTRIQDERTNDSNGEEQTGGASEAFWGMIELDSAAAQLAQTACAANEPVALVLLLLA